MGARAARSASARDENSLWRGAETFDEILKTRGSMDVLEDTETAI